MLRTRKSNASAKRRRFSRVAQSCSLLRTGTYPCSVSERLRIASDASEITAKTRREARLNPSETDLPRVLDVVDDLDVVEIPTR